MIQQEGNPYVKDDTMFIKIMVDFGDMPKTLLPFALDFNSELPPDIQQIPIKEEAERRVQQQPQQQLISDNDFSWEVEELEKLESSEEAADQ